MPIGTFGWINNEPPALDATNLEAMLAMAGAYADQNSFSASPVQSTTVYVSATGNDSHSGTNWNTAKLTLDGAIAALPSTGGRILISASVVTTLGNLTPPAGTTIQGMSRGASTIFCGADLGSGHYLMNMVNSTGVSPIVIMDVAIMGPGDGAFVIGSKPANMSGFKTGPKAKFFNVEIQGFFAGVEVAYEHESFLNCSINSNYYNVYETGAGGSYGNQQFVNCDFTGCTRASLAASGSGVFDTINFVECHVGYGPVGVLKESATTQQGLLTNCNGTLWFEYCANACIFDQTPGGSTSTIVDCRFFKPSFVNYGPALSTYYDASISDAAPVNVGYIAGVVIEDDQSGPGVGTTIYKVGYPSQLQTDKAPAATDYGNYNFTSSTYTYNGQVLATVMGAYGGAITLGQVVQMQGYQAVEVFGNGNTNSYVGVAMHNAASGAMVAVQNAGFGNVLCSDGEVYSGVRLEIDPANPAQVRVVNDDLGSGNGSPTTRAPSTYPVIAVTYSSNAGANTLSPVWFLPAAPNRHLVSPGVVSALPAAGAGYVGQFLIVLGNHTSTADVVYVCLESASGGFSWKTVATG